MQAYMQDKTSAKIQDNVSYTAQYLPLHVIYRVRQANFHFYMNIFI
jgi:hypothetical protein